jgi:BioD-like phosphotransacetylase family protein
MKSIYIVSTTEYAGKSSIALSLALNMKQKGQKVAYMKPIGTLPTKVDGVDSCEDVGYIWQALGKPGDVKSVCPIILLQHFAEKALGKEKTNYKELIKNSAANLSKSYDALVLEGAGNVNQGSFIDLAAADVAKLLKTPTVLIAKYNGLLTLDEILQAADKLKLNLTGVIVNMVPASAKDVVEDIIKPFLNEHNIKFLGYLQQDRLLASVSVAKISQHLNGKVLAAKNHLGKMVESFMVGAMGQEQAISFFRKKANKAVITGGDRSDVQLAALETSTNALILTGNLTPRPLVVSKAEEAEVPVILVREDTLTIIEKTEELLSHIRIHEDQKIEHMRHLLNEHIDLETIYPA